MATSDTTTLLSAELHRPTHREMRAMGKTEARALSDALFARLADLERESAAYSYVRGTIIELNMPLVRFAAAGFRRGTAELDDILQVGTVGLIKAVDGYDHRRGVEFATYAIPTITGEIKRFFRDTSWPLRVPRSLQELYLRVARCSDRLEQTLGRCPPRRRSPRSSAWTPPRWPPGSGSAGRTGPTRWTRCGRTVTTRTAARWSTDWAPVTGSST
ncbi:sigma factor [Kitasatospora gansuensis]